MALPTAATGMLTGLLKVIVVMFVIELGALLFLKAKGWNSTINKQMMHAAVILFGALLLFKFVL